MMSAHYPSTSAPADEEVPTKEILQNFSGPSGLGCGGKEIANSAERSSRCVLYKRKHHHGSSLSSVKGLASPSQTVPDSHFLMTCTISDAFPDPTHNEWAVLS